METLKDMANQYEPPSTKNIADLDKVPVDIEITAETHKNKDGEEFTIRVIEINKDKYRVPGTVLGGIKAILKKMPNLKYVSVIKDGSGMATRYQVIPFVETEVEQVK